EIKVHTQALQITDDRRVRQKLKRKLIGLDAGHMIRQHLEFGHESGLACPRSPHYDAARRSRVAQSSQCACVDETFLEEFRVLLGSLGADRVVLPELELASIQLGHGSGRASKVRGLVSAVPNLLG